MSVRPAPSSCPAGEPLHTSVLPDDGRPPESWTLAEWQGVLEELHYQADNHNEPLFMTAHDGLRWLVSYFLARRLNA